MYKMQHGETQLFTGSSLYRQDYNQLNTHQAVTIYKTTNSWFQKMLSSHLILISFHFRLMENNS